MAMLLKTVTPPGSEVLTKRVRDGRARSLEEPDSREAVLVEGLAPKEMRRWVD